MMSNVTFTLSPNDPCQTEITHPSGKIAYRSTTERGESTVTRVYSSSGKEIASLEWGVGFPDRVTFGGNKPKSITEWMSKSSIPFKEHVTFYDEKDRKYHWKGISQSQKLELYTADDDYKTAICRFESTEGADEAHLVLTQRAIEVQDLVFVSFLFLEKVKRVRMHGSSSLDSGWAVYALFQSLGG